MLLSSVAMVGAGIFCVANGSAAFLSVAFVIGLIFIIMGIVEAYIGTRADFEYMGRGVSFTNDGIIMAVFGAVMLAGQVTDDTTALMLFALWLLIESVLAVGRNTLEFKENTAEQNSNVIVVVLMFILCLIMFFNNRLFNIDSIMLIGIALLLLGINRFIFSFEIQYNKPGFLTGNEERLAEALIDEKRALAKAKEGIREQKNAQARIEKLRKEMARGETVLNDAKSRRDMAEDGREDRA